MLDTIKKLRKELHQNPELSGKEYKTAEHIENFIRENYNTKIIRQNNGAGLAAFYTFSEKGPTIMIRCELDALPIQEVNTFEHKSNAQGVSHKCGHDGHMSIVAGLTFWLKKQEFSHGKVILLFQPAEETGKGAFDLLNDVNFKPLNVDFAFALHNIPGAPLHEIIVIENNFSATVQSLSISLFGKETHAAEPQKGINPTIAIAEIAQQFSDLTILDGMQENFAVLTPIYTNIGDKSYGISAADGEIHYTIRTWSNKAMDELTFKMKKIISTISKQHQLKFETKWFEHFPTAENDYSCNQLIRNAAIENHFNLTEKPHPFKFGEDFGWFSQHYKTAMFGLGAGLKTPALHNPDYDFPDEIIPTGITMFKSIITQILT